MNILSLIYSIPPVPQSPTPAYRDSSSVSATTSSVDEFEVEEPKTPIVASRPLHSSEVLELHDPLATVDVADINGTVSDDVCTSGTWFCLTRLTLIYAHCR